MPPAQFQPLNQASAPGKPQVEKITIMLYLTIGTGYLLIPGVFGFFPDVVAYLPFGCAEYINDPIKRRDFRTLMLAVPALTPLYFLTPWFDDIEFARACIGWRFFWIVPILFYSVLAEGGLPVFLFLSFVSTDLGVPVMHMIAHEQTSYKAVHKTFFGLFTAPEATAIDFTLSVALWVFGMAGFVLSAIIVFDGIFKVCFFTPADVTPMQPFGWACCATYWLGWASIAHNERVTKKGFTAVMITGLGLQLTMALFLWDGILPRTVLVIQIYAAFATVVVVLAYMCKASQPGAE